jgi:CheY-like chemotaxis protein
MSLTHTDLSGRRVLVVEDESRIAMLIRDTLEDMGCEVVATAARFDDAWEKATSLPFDVALLDVNLDGESSYPIAQELANRGRAFVFATGYGTSSLPESLQGAPILQKPFMRSDLERALRAALL